MKTKKSKPLTIRQQIQQCPTLTPDERSLALHGLNKARALGAKCGYNTASTSFIAWKFYWRLVPVIKGQNDFEASSFWNNVDNKIAKWQRGL